MRIPFDAVRSREGAAYLGGAGVVLAITLGIATDTITDYMAQEARTEATRLFLGDDRDARTKLLELEDDVPALLALGSYELERSDLDEQRLETAESYFGRASRLDPTSTPAIMGRVIVLLRRADSRSDRAARRSAAEEASQLLTGVMDASDQDVVYLQGAIDLLLGDTAAAQERLADEARLASGPGMAARYWNLGAAAIVAGHGDALEQFLLGYLMRRWVLPDLSQSEDPEALAPRYEPAAMLGLAYRVALDPRVQPTGKEALNVRCDQALAALAPAHTSGINRGPYQPSLDDTTRIRSSLGLALVSCGRLKEAVEQLQKAARGKPGELLYQRNLAQARYLLAQETQGETERVRAYSAASHEFQKLAKALKGQEGREEQMKLAVTNAAAILLEVGNTQAASQAVRSAQTLYSNPADFHRDMGAILDHAKSQQCVSHYRQAIKLEHPDSRKLERRARQYGR